MNRDNDSAPHWTGEAAARRELAKLGFEVQPVPDGVVIRGDGFVLHARTARGVLADLRGGPRR